MNEWVNCELRFDFIAQVCSNVAQSVYNIKPQNSSKMKSANRIEKQV